MKLKKLGETWADTAASSRLAHLLIIKNSTDQNFLKEIAEGSVLGYEDFEIRSAAIKKLTDPKVLKKIAVNDNNEHIRRAAVRQIEIPEDLKEIVATDRKEIVCCAATRQLGTLAQEIGLKFT